MFELSTDQNEKGYLHLFTNYDMNTSFNICIEIDHEFITFFRILSRYFVENSCSLH